MINDWDVGAEIICEDEELERCITTPEIQSSSKLTAVEL